MAHILPEPADTPLETTSVNKPLPGQMIEKEPKPRQTTKILITLAIAGVLCLIGAYIYDLTTNNSQDNTRKSDILYISNYLNNYYHLYHYYPTLSQINSSAFSAFAPSLNKNKFIDPSSTSSSKLLTSTPQDGSYGYQVSPVGCNNTTVNCTSYKLSAILTSGKEDIVTSPSQSS